MRQILFMFLVMISSVIAHAGHEETSHEMPQYIPPIATQSPQNSAIIYHNAVSQQAQPTEQSTIIPVPSSSQPKPNLTIDYPRQVLPGQMFTIKLTGKSVANMYEIKIEPLELIYLNSQSYKCNMNSTCETFYTRSIDEKGLHTFRITATDSNFNSVEQKIIIEVTTDIYRENFISNKTTNESKIVLFSRDDSKPNTNYLWFPIILIIIVAIVVITFLRNRDPISMEESFK